MRKRKKKRTRRKKLKFKKPSVKEQTKPIPGQLVITIDKEGFDKLRHKLDFREILNLARIVNALIFCFKASFDSGDHKIPSERRQLYYGMAFCQAVLYEGLKAAKKLELYFSDYNSYKKGFEVLLKDPLVEEMMKNGSRFDKIRNRLTYHFYPDIFEEVLKWAEFNSYVFGSSHSDRNIDLFYSLPEDLAINFLIGKKKDEEEGRQIYQKMVQDIASVMARFFTAAQELIDEVLREKGWKAEFITDSQATEEKARFIA